MFFNKRLRGDRFLFLIYLTICGLIICVWFLVLWKFIPSDQIFLTMDFCVVVSMWLIFLPILSKNYKISIKSFFMRFKFMIFFLLFLYFSLGSLLLIARRSINKISIYGHNYFQLMLSTFFLIIDYLIRYVYKILFKNLKHQNNLNSNIFVLQIFAQGIFGFSSAAQISVVASAIFSDFSLYYQYAVTIYSNFILMSNELAKFFKTKLAIFSNYKIKISFYVRKKPLVWFV